SLGIATLGAGLPPWLPHVARWQLPALLRRPRSGRKRIGHARRNVEMIARTPLGRVLRAPLWLVYTPAAQRHHRAFTEWLIRRMDAVIAPSARSGSFVDVPHTLVVHGVDLDKFHAASSPDDLLEASGRPGRYAVGC